LCIGFRKTAAVRVNACWIQNLCSVVYVYRRNTARTRAQEGTRPPCNMYRIYETLGDISYFLFECVRVWVGPLQQPRNVISCHCNNTYNIMLYTATKRYYIYVCDRRPWIGRDKTLLLCIVFCSDRTTVIASILYSINI